MSPHLLCEYVYTYVYKYTLGDSKGSKCNNVIQLFSARLERSVFLPLCENLAWLEQSLHLIRQFKKCKRLHTAGQCCKQLLGTCSKIGLPSPDFHVFLHDISKYEQSCGKWLHFDIMVNKSTTLSDYSKCWVAFEKKKNPQNSPSTYFPAWERHLITHPFTGIVNLLFLTR